MGSNLKAVRVAAQMKEAAELTLFSVLDEGKLIRYDMETRDGKKCQDKEPCMIVFLRLLRYAISDGR